MIKPIFIHSSVRASAQQAKRLTSLQQGAIDHGFHYQGAKQAELWLEVHRCHAPLFTDNSFVGIFHTLSQSLAKKLTGESVHVIGLGSGGGEKEAWLLQALHEVGCSVCYTPVDASIELACLSAEEGEKWVNCDILPIVGDLSLITELPAWLARYPEEEIRLYTAYGISPNFLPGQLFAWLSDILRPQDKLLLSTNLAPVLTDSKEAYWQACQTILPQYDNAETLRWLKQILLDWQIAQYLTEPVFTIEEVESVLGFVAACEWLDNTALLWEGQTLQMKKGDRLRLFFSLRYTPKKLAEMLARFDLQLGEGYQTHCGQEGVWVIEHQ